MKRMHALVSAALLSTCSPALAKQAGETSAVFVADPQIHNVHGSGIKQTLNIVDRYIPVAQRPPELNLLAGYVLEELTHRAVARGAANDAGVVFVLGDATNIGCTGEYDRFRASIEAGLAKAGSDAVVLMAHGNHDTYLMGTANSYVPGTGVSDWRPNRMATAEVPVDESWWGLPEQPTSHQQNTWKHICSDPSGNSLPINKGQWLARYFASLKDDGLSMLPTGTAREGGRFIESRVTAGSRLAALNFEAKGLWVPPRLGEEGQPAKEADLQRTYRSFVVQALDLGDRHRVILIDTSVCEDARGGIYFPLSNAGTNSCIGQAQLETIRTFVDGAKGKHLVVAGHFPLAKISERELLKREFSRHGPRWTYVSAHGHDPMNISREGLAAEVNIGSTTDWPMEVNRLFFADEAGVPAVRNVTLTTAPPIAYVPPEDYSKSEMCRHLDAARMLAAEVASPDAPGAAWESPATSASYAACERRSWGASSADLAEAIEEIRQGMSRKDDAYRRRMLDIAAAASLHEKLGDDASPLKPIK